MAKQQYGLFNPYGHKSKYFYIKDQRKHGHKNYCQNCGSTDCEPGCSYCKNCQAKEHTHYCQICGSTDCEPDYSICNSCRQKHYPEPEYQYETIEVEPDSTVSQSADQYDFMEQESSELIWVKESCNIRVDSKDTQIGVSLQASLQLAISVVLNIAIADPDRREAVSQELFQNFNTDQISQQKVYIYNTKDAVVTTRDTDLAINIQVLLQLLITLVAMVDIL